MITTSMPVKEIYSLHSLKTGTFTHSNYKTKTSIVYTCTSYIYVIVQHTHSTYREELLFTTRCSLKPSLGCFYLSTYMQRKRIKDHKTELIVSRGKGECICFWLL